MLIEDSSPEGGRQERRRARISAWLMINSRPLIATLLACNIFITGAYAYLTPDGDPIADASGVRKNMEDRMTDILLLSEVQTRNILSPARETEEVTRVCRVWGPRSTSKEFRGLLAELDSDGGFPEIKSIEVQAAPTFMVFVDARDRSSQTRQIMQELKAVDVDYFRIQRNDGDIISVGVFSRQELADRQRQKIANLGYLTVVEVLQRSQTVFVLQAYVDAESPHYALSSRPCPLDSGSQVSKYSLN